MNEISTHVVTHMIIFKDKTRMEVTTEQRNQISELQRNPNIRAVDINDINGKKQYISFDTIAKILTWDEFLDQYPDISSDQRVYSTPEPNYSSPEEKFVFDESWAYLESQSWVYREVPTVDRVMMFDKFRRHEGKDFNLFLKSVGAMSKNGFVILDHRCTDKKGHPYRVCLRYPVYNTFKKYLDMYRERKQYGEKKTLQELELSLPK